MADLLSYYELCRLEPALLQKTLRQWSKSSDAEQVIDYLEQGLRHEALPPQVLSAWLGIYTTPSTIIRCLQNENSTILRNSAIKAFARSLRVRGNNEMWSVIGGVYGLLQWMQEASVREVSHLCHALGSLGSAEKNAEHINAHVTGLLKSLTSQHFEDAPYQSLDDRDLISVYTHMLPACSEDFVGAWLAKDTLPLPKMSNLLLAHPALFQKKLLDDISANERVNLDQKGKRGLLTNTPSRPSAIKGISASLQFLINVLDALLQFPRALRDLRVVDNEIVQPILHKLTRNKMTIPKDDLLAIVDKISRLYHIKKGLASDFHTYSGQSKLAPIVQLWVLYPVEMRDHLIYVLGRYDHLDSAQTTRIIAQVPEGMRMSLLRTMLMYLPKYKLDLTKMTTSTPKIAARQWHEDIFFALPRHEACKLLDELIECNVITELNPCDMHSERHLYVRELDDALERLRIRLNRGQAGALPHAEVVLEKQRLKAEALRSPPERAEAVKLVVILAIAAGSIPLLQKVFLWARRYTKDRTASGLLYRRSGLLFGDMADLLTGLSEESLTPSISPDTIFANVKAGNELVLILVETAVLAMKEPDFEQFVWRDIFALLGNIIKRRSKRIHGIRSKLAMTDDDIYEAVWQHTLRTYIKMEGILLEEDSKPLGETSCAGPSTGNGWHNAKLEVQPEPTSLRFFDNLAKARDDLWVVVRRKQDPTVVDLDPCWPAGLPLHFLTSAKLSSKGEQNRSMRYLIHRAREILFRDGREMANCILPTDKASRQAIGPMIETYESALQLWINMDGPDQPRDNMIRLAWTHAVENYSSLDLSLPRRQEFWARQFKSILETLPKDIEAFTLSQQVVLLPGPDPMSTEEWNPQPVRTIDENDWQNQALPFIKVLLTHEPSSNACLGDDFVERPWLVVPFQEEIFEYKSRDVAHASLAEHEAYIASSLLLIEARQCEGPSILAEPFPTSSMIRYPAVFLEQEFLDNSKQLDLVAVDLLGALTKSIPPTLLQKLILSREHTQKHYPEKRSYAMTDFQLLEILAKSDDPSKATELITRIVLERPDDSAWHRLVLHRGLLNSLRSRDVKVFLTSFVQGIFRILEEQRQWKRAKAEQEALAKQGGQSLVQDSAASAGDAEERGPYVKISTIKMLARLLDNAPYISQGDALQVLADLFKSVKHVDIRAAVLQSIINMMLSPSFTKPSAKAQEQIHQVLSAASFHAASMSEQHVMTESAWRAAEEKPEVPEVTDFQTNRSTQTPIRTALLSLFASLKEKERHEEAYDFVQTYILPMIDMSISNHQRWTKLCLRVHGFSASRADILPPITADPELLGHLLHGSAAYMPTRYLETLKGFALFCLNKPRIIDHVTELMTQNKAIKDAGGSHWAYVWGPRKHPCTKLSNTLSQFRAQSERPGCISLQDMQDACIVCLSRMIDAGSRNSAELMDELDRLKPLSFLDATYMSFWVNEYKPVYVQALGKIKAIRTDSWQRDRDRTPDELPEIFNYEMGLLTLPQLPSELEKEQRVVVYVLEVIQVVEKLVNSPEPYHHRFSQLQSWVNAVGSVEYGLNMAVLLARLPEPEAIHHNLQTWLCIELAADLLNRHFDRSYYGKQDRARSKLLQDARRLVLLWRDSPIENLRRYAKGILVKLDKAMLPEDIARSESHTGSL